MTDPAKFTRQEKEQEGTEEDNEREASRKLEESVEKGEGKTAHERETEKE